MFRTAVAVMLCLFAVTAAGKEPNISAIAIGVTRAGESELLAPAFINAVNRYLRRYEPRLLERGDRYVKMTVDYDYDYAIELRIKDHEYEITATLVEKTSRSVKARGQAEHLAHGVQKTMENYLARSGRAAGAR